MATINALFLAGRHEDENRRGTNEAPQNTPGASVLFLIRNTPKLQAHLCTASPVRPKPASIERQNPHLADVNIVWLMESILRVSFVQSSKYLMNSLGLRVGENLAFLTIFAS